jgi:hypothetical protein
MPGYLPGIFLFEDHALDVIWLGDQRPRRRRAGKTGSQAASERDGLQYLLLERTSLALNELTD